MTDRTRAVVLGAGIGGLLAARALSDHVDQVTIVERDSVTDAVGCRPGTQQGRHAHALLAGGQRQLEAMLPGFTAEVEEAGARVGDVLEVSRLHFSGHRLHHAHSGLVVISASRPLIEQHICRRVLDIENVELADERDVVGVTVDRSGTRVSGIRLVPRADGSAEEALPADVVVDATGRTGRTSTWLREIGVEPPREERIVVDVAYATRRYRMGPTALDGDLAVICAPTTDSPRMGGLALLEDDVGMLTVAGMCGDRPPLDPTGFDEFVRSLAADDIVDAVSGAEPLDDPVPHRFPASRWHRYDEADLPDGFAVIGDGVCSLNPIYGQGMTLAALEAGALASHLDRHGRVRGRRLQREIARIVRPAWQMSAGADLQFPGVAGTPSASQRMLARYVARLHGAAARDPRLSQAFIRVAGMVDPPPALLRPSVALRTLRPRRAASSDTHLEPLGGRGGSRTPTGS